MSTQPTEQHTPTPQDNTPPPRLYHYTEQIEPDGTTHTLCGLTFHKRPLAGSTARADRLPCPVCTATAYLMEATE